MAQTISLTVATRTATGRQVSALRRQGVIPAVMYGYNTEPKNVQIDYNTFVKAYKIAGESSIVDLTIDQSTPVKVLIHDTSRDPVTHRFAHIDFYVINMTEKLTTHIPLKFTGEAPAVKELGGVLVRVLNELEVTCLPSDLVSEIEVDIRPLKTFQDLIHTSDIKLPPGITITSKTNDTVVKAVPPRSDEELKALDAEVKEKEAIETVKVVGEEKKKADEAAATAPEEKKK